MIKTSQIKNRNQKHFFRLERIMQEKAPYLNPDLSRRQLAEMLATNENYLYQALRYGVPSEKFNDYVNRYRLDYAVRLLVETPDAKIEAIAFNAGFRARQTFYRYFRARFNMTPIEYQRRKLHKQEEKM